MKILKTRIEMKKKSKNPLIIYRLRTSTKRFIFILVNREMFLVFGFVQNEIWLLNMSVDDSNK